ncbi:MAG: flavodoxin family protein [Candidatus Eremiobacteraeota bacterium]|nr:flavodoxin family protein [Candidatus Eremiobacteraeota bacterium]
MASKVLGFMTSPRKKGNSDTLIDEALKGAESRGAETEKITLCDLALSPCIECGGCNKTGKCVVNDDFQKIYRDLATEHFFIFATPLFFAGVSSLGKCLIDRCQCMWVAKYRLRKAIAPKSPNRRGLLIASKGMPGKDKFEHLKAEVKSFFTVNNIVYFDELLADDCDGKGAAREREDLLREAFTCGERLITN